MSACGLVVAPSYTLSASGLVVAPRYTLSACGLVVAPSYTLSASGLVVAPRYTLRYCFVIYIYIEIILVFIINTYHMKTVVIPFTSIYCQSLCYIETVYGARYYQNAGKY